MKRDWVVTFFLPIAVLGGLLVGFTNATTPSRHPVLVTATTTDYIYVHDSSVGGASAGVPNTTAKSIPSNCDGTGVLVYDSQTTHAFSCVQVDNTNVDAGSPFGSVTLFSGYNAIGTSGVDKVIQATFYPIVRPLTVGTTTEIAGVGAGNYTVELFDSTASSSLCVTGNIVCSTAVGTTTSVDCKAAGAYPQTSAIKHDLLLRMNCASCTTCPSGNVYSQLQTVPGN